MVISLSSFHISPNIQKPQCTLHYYNFAERGDQVIEYVNRVGKATQCLPFRDKVGVNELAISLESESVLSLNFKELWLREESEHHNKVLICSLECRRGLSLLIYHQQKNACNKY
jgi:hypothetical protein